MPALTAEKISNAKKMWESRFSSGEPMLIDASVTESSLMSWLMGFDDDEELEPDGDGIITISIDQPLCTRDYDWSGMGYGSIRRMVEAAIKNPDCYGIEYYFHSPGGQSEGMAELCQYLRSVRNVKPTVSYGPMMTSASYGLAVAASPHVIGTPTGVYGSIGVRMDRWDYSEYYRKQGIKVEHIVTGKYKTEGSYDQPITDEERVRSQKMCETVFKVFIAEVEAGRPRMTEEEIRGLQASIYMGDDAIKKELIDAVGYAQDARAYLLAQMEGRKMKNIAAKLGMSLESTEEQILSRLENDASTIKATGERVLTLEGDLKSYQIFATKVMVSLKSDNQDAAVTALTSLNTAVANVLAVSGKTTLEDVSKEFTSLQERAALKEKSVYRASLDALYAKAHAASAGIYPIAPEAASHPMRALCASIEAKHGDNIKAAIDEIEPILNAVIASSKESAIGPDLSKRNDGGTGPASNLVSFNDLMARADGGQIFNGLERTAPALAAQMVENKNAKLYAITVQ